MTPIYQKRAKGRVTPEFLLRRQEGILDDYVGLPIKYVKDHSEQLLGKIQLLRKHLIETLVYIRSREADQIQYHPWYGWLFRNFVVDIDKVERGVLRDLLRDRKTGTGLRHIF